MLLLRSQSPRRKEILSSLGLSFRVEVMPIDESSRDSESPLEYLERVTRAKLGPISDRKEEVSISSDTIVVFENEILQKPVDEKDALNMLSLLNGRNHIVYSGLGIRTYDSEIFDFDFSEVSFQDWEEDKILDYIRKQKPFDKAGAYGIQDNGSPVLKFEGSYTNILGFPIRKFFQYNEIWRNFL